MYIGQGMYVKMQVCVYGVRSGSLEYPYSIGLTDVDNGTPSDLDVCRCGRLYTYVVA